MGIRRIAFLGRGGGGYVTVHYTYFITTFLFLLLHKKDRFLNINNSNETVFRLSQSLTSVQSYSKSEPSLQRYVLSTNSPFFRNIFQSVSRDTAQK